MNSQLRIKFIDFYKKSILQEQQVKVRYTKGSQEVKRTASKDKYLINRPKWLLVYHRTSAV